MEGLEGMEMQMQINWGAMVVPLLIGLGVFVFFAFCLAKLAEKCGLPFKSSFIKAIIPVANIILIPLMLLEIAKKPTWWIVLFLVPVISMVISIIVWIAIAERRGKPGWWGVTLFFVPILNIYQFLVLCLGK